MRRLVLMRHAKTQSHNPSGDHARELLPTGIQDAQEAGALLRNLGLQHALVSTATRARQTFAALGLDIPVDYLDSLYRDGTETLLRHISETDPQVSGLLVVGHAPTIPALASQLTRHVDRETANSLAGWYPTACFTQFTFDGDWSSVASLSPENIRLERVERH